MLYSLTLCSEQNNSIKNFLMSYYNNYQDIKSWDFFKKKNNNSTLYSYKKRTTNPMDFVVLLGAIVDNNSTYPIDVWLSLDNDIFINITTQNIDMVIKYIYERFPY